MTRLALRVTAYCLIFGLGCADSDGDDGHPTTLLAEQQAPLTYWHDMAPLFADHCMQCHRAGGIAPLRLDDYAQLKPLAKLIAHVTSERTMPPWSVTSDGTCGEFSDSLALSDDEIARIGAWASAGAIEGKREPLSIPDLPSLSGAVELKTPNFEPQVQPGALTAHDEYRCFELDPPTSGFITGYEVIPGRPEIVHHALVMLVDPEAPAARDQAPGKTNLEQMRALDQESPDRDGWQCFGMAGEGVRAKATPVVWAPGQGVVQYPNDSGVPLKATDKIVVQIHYNLADARNHGLADQTTVRLRSVPRVANVGLFALQDPLLGTLQEGDPVSLPPGQASTVYSWTQTAREMGLDSLPEAQLYGIMPHMHQLGRKYRMTVAAAGQDERCAADVQHWDFHWQRMYFYEQPITLRPDSRVSVSCDYDTSGVSTPVLPGWGTGDEMCLATLYVTVPLAAFSAQ